MMIKQHLTKIAIITILGSILQACGGASDSSSTVTTVAPGAIGPHTIAISYPISDSVQNLGGGFYRRIGKVTVTDSEGNGIAGVVVNLRLIDSILAQGTIMNGTADYISSTTLFDTNPTLGDGTTATTFDQAWVSRNDSIRFIRDGDHVLLFNAEEADKRRFVSTTSPGTNTLYVGNPYTNGYPNAVYDSSTPERTTSYVIGASLLGSYVTGTTGVANQTVTDSEGIGTFYVTYPNSVRYINAGCPDALPRDSRYPPTGSSQVLIAAWANDDVTAVNYDFCFSPIAGGTFEPDSITVSAGTTVSFVVRDGGDSVAIPFTYVSFTDGAATFPAGQYTDANGVITVTFPTPGTVKLHANRGATTTITVN